MQSSFELTPKQADYIRNANHRWNVACGAVRSGKSFLQISYCIPMRLLERKGKRGLRVILGATRANIERNVLQPMRDIYGDSVATGINSQNQCKILGEKVYCIGADNVRQVAKIRGSEIAYCAIDEATDINKEVFEMLKSRLSLPWSCCDVTTNPAAPSHWFKEFLDSVDKGVDVYCQNYTIYDNPFLPKKYVHALEAEYRGTVWFDRYILGKWTLAEGAVYPRFAANPKEFILGVPPQIKSAVIGVDFGGGKSGHAFQCVGFTRGMREMIVLEEYYSKQALDPNKLEQAFVEFVKLCQSKYPVIDVYCDSAEQTLINGLRMAAAKSRLGVNIGNAMKKPINDRIRCACRMMGNGRFFIMSHCTVTIEAYQAAVYDGKNQTEDVRLDDGTTNIDTLDATEYCYEREIDTLMDIGA